MKKMVLAENPELMAEFHPSRNGPIQPSEISCSSRQRIWWLCPKGHEYQMSVSLRVKGSGCPHCSGRLVCKGETDLATLYPELAEQWVDNLNAPLTPTEVSCGSNKKVYWECPKGHVWKAQIVERVKGRGCPYCAGKLAIQGENDLATLRPDLAADWDIEKNAPLLPTQVTCGSSRYVHWKCANGHESWGQICVRARGKGCPYCNGRREISRVYISIPPEHPSRYSNQPYRPKTIVNQEEKGQPTLWLDLEAEWDQAKNGPFLPTEVFDKTGRMVWWRCSKGHSWQESINNRLQGKGCPYCSGRIRIQGKNNLATLRPDLVAEWDYDKNAPLLPTEVSCSSSAKVCWKCSKGHEWSARINSRVQGKGCPYCSGRLPIQGETDLATIRPDLAEEWDTDRNAPLLPSEVSCGSNKLVSWKCSKGHGWVAAVKDRTRGYGCPYCSGRLAIPGETDLATLYPEIAAEWDFSKNNNLSPENVTSKSNKKVWWVCKNGDSWAARIQHRTSKGSGCPYCLKRKKQVIKFT